MTSPAILVFDPDATSFQTVQKSFFNENVDVVWASPLGPEQVRALQCAIILYAVRTTEDYERAYEINRTFEDAVMFLLADQYFYDAFEARNAGAVGAFFKPLHVSRIYERIVELLPNFSVDNGVGTLDSIYIPSESERRAKVVSFLPTSPVK